MSTTPNDPDRVQKLTEELRFVARIDDHLAKLVGVGFDAHKVGPGLALAEWFRNALELLDRAAHAFRDRRAYLESMLEVPPEHDRDVDDEESTE